MRTYVQSGNLVFAAGRKAGALEAKLERGIEERFGFEVPVFVRDAAAWSALRAPNPWPALAARDPANLLVALTKSAPRPAAASALKEHARGSERVVLAAGALWIHYANGNARSKLTPALLDRCAGSSVTARNWRTVVELEGLLLAP